MFFRVAAVLFVLAACASRRSEPAKADHSDASPPKSTGSVAAPASAKPDNHLEDFLRPDLAGQHRTSFGKYEPAVFAEVLSLPNVAAYRDCGAVAAADADYDNKEHVMIFDMGTPLGALCIFASEKTLDGKPEHEQTGPDSEAYRRPGGMFMRRGRYYARIRGSELSFGGGKAAVALLHALASVLPRPTAVDPEIARLQTFPTLGRIPGSDKYLPHAVFGVTVLTSGFTADFGCGEDPMGVARVALSGDQTPLALLAKTKSELEQQGYKIAPSPYGAHGLVFTKNGKPMLYVLAGGRGLGVVEIDKPPAECEHLMREFVGLLDH